MRLDPTIIRKGDNNRMKMEPTKMGRRRWSSEDDDDEGDAR